MDLIGEIVEHNPSKPVPPSFPAPSKTGFPSLKKPSQWRRRSANGRNISSSGKENPLYSVNSNGEKRLREKRLNYDGLSESERIHQENIELLSRMSVEEREMEKNELLDSLDPDVLRALISRSEKRVPNKHKEHAMDEDVDGWIGGGKGGLDWGEALDRTDVDKALGVKSLEQEDFRDEDEATQEEVKGEDKKKVRFDNVAKIMYDTDDPQAEDEEWEDVEELDDLIPGLSDTHATNQQMVEEMTTNVHFPKPKAHDFEETEDFALDLDDPDFQDKLHEKYFPDLPKDTAKLKWMEPLPPIPMGFHYESINDLRFDFKGNLIPSNTHEIPTYIGLHHHSANPEMPGYTFQELAHLARSTLASQRCIAIQTIGRILHKLGKHKYEISPVGEEINENTNENFENMLWEIIGELRVISSLQEAADEKVTKNLSVRNYAIEALWLWRQGGGDKRVEKTKQENV